MLEETRPRPAPFGLAFSSLGVSQAVEKILSTPPATGNGVRALVTANIQHVALMRRDAEFREAMLAAAMTTCDGFPVYRYALMRGCRVPARVTGREITAGIMQDPALAARHRLYFVVDGPETAAAIEHWAQRRGLAGQTMIAIPSADFGSDTAYSRDLAQAIARARPTMLFLCVGAPRSELFIHRHRDVLPNCWALCVGQSVKLALGLVPQPPRLAEALNLEWLWRIFLEPRRLIGRYVAGAFGFAVAIAEDLARSRPIAIGAAPPEPSSADR